MSFMPNEKRLNGINESRCTHRNHYYDFAPEKRRTQKYLVLKH